MGTIENLFFNHVETLLNDYGNLLQVIEKKILIDEENFSNKNSVFMSDISTEDSISQNDDEMKIFNSGNSEMPKNAKNSTNLMAKELTLKGLYLELLEPLNTIKE